MYLGPIRTSGQVLNVITFLTKTKLSRQVIDILKKTKGVIIIRIALHVQDIGPFEDLSVLTKFAVVQQVVRTCFCNCLTKCIARATRTNHKTTASLFS